MAVFWHRPNVLIGRKIFHFDKITSTNDACAKLAEYGEDEGAVVIADGQTKGRGRFKRSWFSPHDEGLYLSILLNPKIDQKYFPLITLAAALSVADAIRDVSSKLEPSIEWPNDVFVNSKKISGVLTEKKNSYLILGLGVNINNDVDSFPDYLKEEATSLKIETGESFDRHYFLSKLFDRFEKYYALITEGKNDEIVKQVKRASRTLGRKDFGVGVYGKALDIDETGALIIKDVGGKILKMTSGDLLDGNQRS